MRTDRLSAHGPQRVFIVDDERLARMALRDALADRGDVTIVGEADSVDTAVSGIARCDPDIIFLDVQLLDGNGFQVLERVAVRGHVVFVTAYGSHALRAFEVNALDYLVKPLEPEHVARALARAATTSRTGALATHPGSASDHVPRFRMDDRICLQDARSIKFCRVHEIAFVGAANGYGEIHLVNGAVLLVSQRLKYWEERLPEAFTRIHRSTLVNLELIDELQLRASGWQLRLRGHPEPLPVSRRLVPGLKARLRVPE
ncbi:MAG: LytTR family DNA-binding domain-containing protein [Myxococcota bacterium]